MKRPFFLVPFALLVIFSGIAALRLLTADPDTEKFVAREDRAAPAGTFETLDAEAPFDFAASGPVAVNLFASWCAPCRAEHDYLMQLAADGDIQLVGVLYKDTDPAGQAFLDELGNPFSRVIRDADGLLGLDFGITGVPETFLIDANGRIVRHFRGMIGEEDVAEIRAFFAAETAG